MEKKDLIIWEEYFYVSSIFIASCWVLQINKHFIVEIEWEWKVLNVNNDRIHKTFDDAKAAIITKLERDIKTVARYFRD